MEVSSTVDVPLTDVELVPEKIEDAKEAGPSFGCDLCDAEVIHKIAQEFLPGLATACVDNTTGDMFRSPGSVAADIRKEMMDYLIQRSETFVAESVVLEGGPEAEASDHPYDIITDFIDDFASSKRNLFSRVSGWLLSEKREDKIDEFVQEMEINGFWLMDRREALAQTLLKNVDFKNAFHCDMKFNSIEELDEHVINCDFRSMNCENEGCNSRFSANQMEKHDSVCPFKIIPCEQKCSDSMMRREMDRHCITVCPMKLVNCPFYAVGCQSTVPHCMMENHRSESLHSHLLYILQGFYKEASVQDLERRVEQLEKASSSDQLAQARDARSLTLKVKKLEAKLGPLEVTSTKKAVEETTEDAVKDVEEKVQSLEVTDSNKDSTEAAKENVNSLQVVDTKKDCVAETAVKDAEEKVESLQVTDKNKDSNEAAVTAVKDAKEKVESSQVIDKNKDSNEAAETAAKDSEEKSAQSIDKNKDSNEAAEPTVTDVEKKVESLYTADTNEATKA